MTLLPNLRPRAAKVSNAAVPKSWSLAMVRGKSLAELSLAAKQTEHIFSAADVTDLNAGFVADPFAIQVAGEWYLFFEVMDNDIFRGALGVAKSRDLTSWEYLGLVFRPDFHVSYPFVFEHGGEHFMIPETRAAREVTIYRARRFPFDWQPVKTILRGKYFDSSFVYYQDRYWLFAGWWSYWMKVFHAPHPLGPWQALTWPFGSCYAPGKARPGGKAIVLDEQLYRFGQDNRRGYGHQLQAFQVTTLSPHWFAEKQLTPSPFLEPTGHGWNAGRMHHLDVHVLPDGELLGFIDGSPELVK